jgi:hypothetical protein
MIISVENAKNSQWNYRKSYGHAAYHTILIYKNNFIYTGGKK